jgi:hypothetical protein
MWHLHKKQRLARHEAAHHRQRSERIGQVFERLNQQDGIVKVVLRRPDEPLERGALDAESVRAARVLGRALARLDARDAKPTLAQALQQVAAAAADFQQSSVTGRGQVPKDPTDNPIMTRRAFL